MGSLRKKMDGIRDKVTGTKYPDSGVTPLPVMELRDALLAINGPDVPFVVRHAHSADKADLVAEWQVREPVYGSSSSPKHVERKLKIRMRFVPLKREVLSVDEQWTVTWAGNPGVWAESREYSRGQVLEVSWRGGYERGPDGRRHKVETFRYDTRDMKNPLRDAVLGAGWTWRGVMRMGKW